MFGALEKAGGSCQLWAWWSSFFFFKEYRRELNKLNCFLTGKNHSDKYETSDAPSTLPSVNEIYVLHLCGQMLGCGIKQTNHIRHHQHRSALEPVEEWAQRVLGWKQKSRCQLAFQTPSNVDKEAGGGFWRHVTQQTPLPKMCVAVFHFSLDSGTSTPQPAIITSETKGVLSLCCDCSDTKEITPSLSSPPFPEFKLFGFKVAMWENAPAQELLNQAKPGASYLVSQTSGALE